MTSARAVRWRRVVAPLCAAALLLSPSIASATSADGASVTSPAPQHEPTAPRDQARPVTVGSHTGLSDAIDPAGEYDWFVFDAPRAGSYIVEVYNAASTLEPRMRGYSGNSHVATGDYGDGAVAQRMTMSISIPGQYHVRVNSYRSNQRGTYKLRVLPQYDQGLTWMANGEPDGHRLLAPQVSLGRSGVGRAIEPVPSELRRSGADVDWIRFSAPQAGVYTVETFDAPAEMEMSGWDRGGNRMTGSEYGSGVVDRYSELRVSIPGDYFVRTSAARNSDSGAYKVRVLPQYDQGLTWNAQHEPNNTRMTGFSTGRGKVIESSAEVRRSGTRDRADVDWFNFPVKTGAENIVEITPNGFRADLRLYDQAGSRVASRSCSAGQACSISAVATLPGRYHVRVAPAHSSESGTYSVCMRAAGESCAKENKVTRLGGSDRYATAARVAAQFSADQEVVFIASGANFPDALAGAARAGAVDAPVLLTRAGSLPSATTAELSRLRPQRIIVLGGTGVVNDTVLRDLRPYARSQGADAVTRISGSDRYATSARISALYSPGVATAYVATGRAFPDALSGAALAGTGGAPLLLVDPNRIPSSIDTELRRLRPQRIVILGGTGAVSGEVAKALERYATATSSKVTRIAGTDRYETSAAVAARFPANVQGAYVATGASFPDALAGAALAGTRNSPVLLTRIDALPSPVVTQLHRLRPAHGYVIGSTGVVSEAVARQLGQHVR